MSKTYRYATYGSDHLGSLAPTRLIGRCTATIAVKDLDGATMKRRVRLTSLKPRKDGI